MFDINRYQYSSGLGNPIQDLKNESTLILKDIMQAFNFKIFVNTFTGKQNLTQFKNKPLSLVAVLVNDEFFKYSLEFYDTDSFIVKHRKYNQFFCLHEKGYTFILQKNLDKDLIFVIRKGTIIEKLELEKYINSNTSMLKDYANRYERG